MARTSVEAAVRALRGGRLVVYPTDTLYGLGALATNGRAVERLDRAKGRPPGMPLSFALSSVEEIETYARLSPAARAFLRRELPGPLTALLPASERARRRLAPPALGEGGTVGVRVPDHPVARELARRVGPVTCTSANRHGRPPIGSIAEARDTFGREVAAYLDGEPAPSGSPSRIVDLTRGEPRIVRPGAGAPGAPASR
jgi:L-threonylcarbamoyladenylate synthase